MLKESGIRNSNLKKAIFVLLYDQFDIPDMDEEDSDSSYVDYIINALIEKNGNRCPFKCYDCIGHCKNNLIGCAEGLTADCDKEIEEIWKDFIGIQNDKVNSQK